MAKEIKLRIATPSKIYLETDVASVIIPAVRADVNILPQRAPSVFVLDFGVLQILGDDGAVKSKYFIQSGMAEIADNQCKVMTQGIIPYEDVTFDEARKKFETAQDEQERLFFQMILDTQLGIQRHYLRTLRFFVDRKKETITQEELISHIKADLEILKQNQEEW